MKTNFNYLSYKLHEKHFTESLNEVTLDSWKKKDTVDYWRHENMYKCLLPLIESYPESNWLTIGDGRYGTDANFLISNGIKNVLASDISDTLLKIAKLDNFILDYKVENAEQLSFEDNSFDFVLCKEAYHHFPRPAIALYEMLRVANKAVILIEPMDKNVHYNQENLIVKVIRSITNIFLLQIKGIYRYENFEEVGNYIYTISEREINKVALGLNLKFTHFKRQNDYYIKGAEHEKLNSKGPIYKKINQKIKLSNFLSKIGLMQYGLLISILSKDSLSSPCVQKLSNFDFATYRLPDNPYL